MKRKHKRRNLKKQEDQISSLPDCLLIEIISRLPETQYAIRTGTLSKRWQHLWPQVPNLIISRQVTKGAFRFYSSVERIISQSNNPLNKLILQTFYTKQTKSQVNNCIRNAIIHNVQKVDLDLYLYPSKSFWDYRFLLPDFFFISSSFIHLTLSKCEFKQADVVSWENLRTLHIEDAELHQDAIKNILSGSPLLETLMLDGCRFELLDITNKSVKNLVFFWCIGSSLDSVEINAPYILSLTIQGCLPLEKHLLLNVSSVIKAELDYEKKYFRGESRREYDELNEEILKGLLLSLGYAKEVKIGKRCLEALAGLKAKGFTFPSNLKVLGEIDSNGSED